MHGNSGRRNFVVNVVVVAVVIVIVVVVVVVCLFASLTETLSLYGLVPQIFNSSSYLKLSVVIVCLYTSTKHRFPCIQTKRKLSLLLSSHLV